MTIIILKNKPYLLPTTRIMGYYSFRCMAAFGLGCNPLSYIIKKFGY
jgi:hypothetical protein